MLSPNVSEVLQLAVIIDLSVSAVVAWGYFGEVGTAKSAMISRAVSLHPQRGWPQEAPAKGGVDVTESPVGIRSVGQSKSNGNSKHLRLSPSPGDSQLRPNTATFAVSIYCVLSMS